jgi:hypothetical protein
MLTLFLLAAVAAPDGKTAAMDDWHQLAITGVAGEASGPLYVRVQAADLDGDGRADGAVLKLVCAAGKLTSASYVVSPRDIATGQASGKRQHGSITIVKEWGAASPDLQKMKPQYDVKSMKSARMAGDGWTAITLSNADGLCGAVQAAVVKSKSNITNN